MNVSSPTSNFKGITTYAPPPPTTPTSHYQLVNSKDKPPLPSVPALTCRKARYESVSIYKRPEDLYFLMTPCSLRSLLPDQAYTKFPQASNKSDQRTQKIRFDLEP